MRSFGNYNFLIVFGAAILLGLIFGKGYRKAFFLPAVIITVAALNPIVKELIDRNDGGNVYWRAFWLIPIVAVSAAVPAIVVGRAKKIWLAIGTIAVSIVIIVCSGSFVYAHDNTTFGEAQNSEKLPEAVVKIGAKLLDMDDSPRVVADASLSTYFRQYSGKIKMPYGRSVRYGTPSSLGKTMYEELGNGEYEALATLMENYDYEYLITNNIVNGQQLADAGYEFLEQVDIYGIYRVHGKRTEKREYDGKGQVLSLTYLDDAGNIVAGSQGYATVLYDYNTVGKLIYEFHLDADGQGVTDNNGRAGYRYERDNRGLITKTIYLGTDGEILKTGCAERVYGYDGKKIAEETYLDYEGKLVNTGIGYARIRHEYKGDQLSLSYFYDADGNEVECGSSYFHRYLRSLIEKRNEDTMIFISIKDEGTVALTVTLMDDLYDLGIKTDLMDKYRSSYYAVIKAYEIVEDISNSDEIQKAGQIDDMSYEITSAGFLSGNRSSIIINGTEHSKNVRGMNIVVVENGQVTEAVTFDTFSREMRITR